MPNWCENSLAIEGPKVEILALLDAINDQKGNLDGGVCTAIDPMPDDVGLGTMSMPGWYVWRVNNWGTKWDFMPIDDPDLVIVDDNTFELVMEFDTAWAPPIALYNTLVERGFSVKATYHEPGMQYVGVYSDGDDETYEYDDSTSENVKENVPVTLVDKYDLVSVIAEIEANEEEEEV